MNLLDFRVWKIREEDRNPDLFTLILSLSILNPDFFRKQIYSPGSLVQSLRNELLLQSHKLGLPSTYLPQNFEEFEEWETIQKVLDKIQIQEIKVLGIEFSSEGLIIKTHEKEILITRDYINLKEFLSTEEFLNDLGISTPPELEREILNELVRLWVSGLWDFIQSTELEKEFLLFLDPKKIESLTFSEYQQLKSSNYTGAKVKGKPGHFWAVDFFREIFQQGKDLFGNDFESFEIIWENNKKKELFTNFFCNLLEDIFPYTITENQHTFLNLIRDIIPFREEEVWDISNGEMFTIPAVEEFLSRNLIFHSKTEKDKGFWWLGISEKKEKTESLLSFSFYPSWLKELNGKPNIIITTWFGRNWNK